jgi:Fur family peroxide stress response transcriptional regulator
MVKIKFGENTIMSDTLETLAGVLKERGFNVTHQRLIIYRALMESKDHPSAEDIYNRVRETDPIISLGTVYKSLEMFENLGLIQRVNQLYHTARYDGDMAPHGHIICRRCEQIMDVFWKETPEIPLPKGQKHGYQIDGMNVHYVGICPECQKKGN